MYCKVLLDNELGNKIVLMQCVILIINLPQLRILENQCIM